MYKGWIGAPRLVTHIISQIALVDGEFAYDCAFFDMAIVVGGCLCCLWLLWGKCKSGRK